MQVATKLLILLVCVLLIKPSSSGRSYSRGSSNRGGSSWGSSSYSKPSSSSSWSSSSYSKPSTSYSKPSSSSSGSKPSYGWNVGGTGTHHSTSHVLPVSTGNRNKPTYNHNTPRTTFSHPTSKPHQSYNHNTPRVTYTRPTSAPQLHQRVTPKPVTPHRHNTTGGIGFSHPKNDRNTGRNTTGGFYVPSAPPAPSSNHFAPSAPPAPGIQKQQITNTQSQPSAPPAPGPGWNPGVTHGAGIQQQHVTNTHNQYPAHPPPPYPGQAPPPYPGYHPGQAPPPYPGNTGYHPGQALPPYPGNTGYHPGQAPPPYPGHTGHASPYPQQPTYYPQQAHYPSIPPPPPGYTPYVPYYKDKSGIRGSDVVAGLALWELMRSNNHHHGYGGYGGFGYNPGVQQVHHHYHDGAGPTNVEYSYQPTYHDTMRERYTTRIEPSRTTSQKAGPGAYNILEMTHYVTPDDEGQIYSTQGNMTCISVYNAKSVSNWHHRQVKDFERQYPNTTFPLYRLENDTSSDNFTVVPGRIIHREPISITCCGTNKGKLDLNLLTNGKHPDVNCVNHIGHIPIRKLTFVKVTRVVLPSGNITWYPVTLTDPNNTTPTPLAPFPTNMSTPLAPFPTHMSTPLAPFPNTTQDMSSTTGTPLASFPTVATNATVDLNQTFSSLGTKNDSVDLSQIFPSLGDNVTETVPVTNNPSDIIVG